MNGVCATGDFTDVQDKEIVINAGANAALATYEYLVLRQ